MGEFLKNTLEFLSLLKNRYYFWDGLLLSAGIAIYADYLFWTEASDLLKSVLEGVYPEKSLLILISAKVGSYALILLVVLAVWVYKRRVRKFPIGKEIGRASCRERV